jgi:hypothetical protein
MSIKQPKGIRLGGRQKGTKNKATILREQMVARAAESHAAENGFDLKNATDLERLDWIGLQFINWLEKEKAKGKRADPERMIVLLREACAVFSKTAQYRHPKLAVHRILEPPRSDEPLLVRLRVQGEPDRYHLNGKPISEAAARALPGNGLERS